MMTMVIGLIISMLFVLIGVVSLVLALLKKRRIITVAMIISFVIAIGAFIFTVYEGNRFARDYNDGPNEFNDAAIDENYMKPTYNIVLKREHEEDNEISSLPLGMYMNVIDYDAFEQTLTVKISNQSGYEMTYGNEYSLQKLVDDEWIDIEPEGEYAWTDIAHIIKDLEDAEEVYDISMFGDLDEGTYRFCKTDLYAEFTLYREWTE